MVHADCRTLFFSCGDSLPPSFGFGLARVVCNYIISTVRDKGREIRECRIALQRSVNAGYLRNLRWYMQRPLKAQRSCSIFHIDSNGDESTGKEPLSPGFSCGEGVPTDRKK